MGASTLRLLSASVLLVGGLALAPAMAATAAPAVHAVTAQSAEDIPALTRQEAVLDAAAQHVSDGGSMALVDTAVEPPAWLLLLLVPILLGGTVGVGVTLRRLQ